MRLYQSISFRLASRTVEKKQDSQHEQDLSFISLHEFHSSPRMIIYSDYLIRKPGSKETRNFSYLPH